MPLQGFPQSHSKRRRIINEYSMNLLSYLGATKEKDGRHMVLKTNLPIKSCKRKKLGKKYFKKLQNQKTKLLRLSYTNK